MDGIKVIIIIVGMAVVILFTYSKYKENKKKLDDLKKRRLRSFEEKIEDEREKHEK